MSLDWYPQIDYSQCLKCLICYDICPHGVYDLDNDAPVVVKPENCISKCHGCENQCPQGAISYFGDTGIKKPCGGDPVLIPLDLLVSK